jgi:hypothetical protein
MRRLIEFQIRHCPVLILLGLIRDTAEGYIAMIEWIGMETIEHIDEMIEEMERVAASG